MRGWQGVERTRERHVNEAVTMPASAYYAMCMAGLEMYLSLHALSLGWVGGYINLFLYTFFSLLCWRLVFAKDFPTFMLIINFFPFFNS